MFNPNSQDLNTEVNLLPVISLLAVCITFLLVTAVWIQSGTLDIKQAVGGSGAAEKSWSLSANFNTSGDIELKLTDPKKHRDSTVGTFKNGKSGISWKKFSRSLERIKKKHPELKTAYVLPKDRSSFEDVIRVIDTLKKFEIMEVGISPI